MRTRSDRQANAWLESFNPLRNLSIRTAQMIFDAARRGNDVRLQWIYENMEQADPTLMICAERRSGALVDLDWIVRPKATGRVRDFDQTLADEQTAFLETVYGDAEEANLFPAIEHLASAFFRGHAHALPLWSPDGLTLRGFDLLNSWNVCRDLLFGGRWHWNPYATETIDFNTLEAIPPKELCTLVRSRHIDYPAMAIYLRNGLGESAWGKFLERYGIPPVIITMPENIDPNQVDVYCSRAALVADGGSGALPYGCTVAYATEARGTNPFRDFLDHQQQLIVLMATGGMLTSLTGATGIGQGATGAHEETWRSIVRRDASAIATVLNRTVSDTLLNRAFLGKPHLAQFDFETEPPLGADEVFDLAAKAVSAGYRVTRQELEERTGYRLEDRPDEGLAPPLDPAVGVAGPPPSPARQFWNVQNKALPEAMPPTHAQGRASAASTPPETPPLSPSAGLPPHAPAPIEHCTLNTAHRSLTAPLAALATSLQLDLTPAADAVQTFLQNPTPQAAKALARRLPELLPDDPETAAILEQTLAEAFADTIAEEAPEPPASMPTVPQGGVHAPVANSENFHKCPKCGKFASYDGSCDKCGETLPEDKMIQRGRDALSRALDGKPKDVKGAMHKPGLGRIDFLHGWEGKGKSVEHGKGLAKIIQKHNAELDSLPETIAKGRVYKIKHRATGNFAPDAMAVIHGSKVAFLSRHEDGWVVISHYEDERKARQIEDYN